MAQQNPLLVRTFNLSSDYNHLSANSTGFYLAVRIGDADLGCGRVQTAGARPIGISQEPRKKGQSIAVAVAGISKWRLGATVTRGDALCADATARAVRYLGSTSKHVYGIALASGVVSEVVECEIGGIGYAPTGTVATL